MKKVILFLISVLLIISATVSCENNKPAGSTQMWRVTVNSIEYEDELVETALLEELAELNNKSDKYTVEEAEALIDDIAESYDGYIECEIVLELSEDGGKNWDEYQSWNLYLNSEPEEPVDPEEYEYVDLGLPSGTLWATCNIGAEEPQEPGFHFAWGEIEPKVDYSSDFCITYDVVMQDIAGNPEFDAATANWGANWCMPTKAQAEELLNECSAILVTGNGFVAYEFTGPNGNTLVLPLAGYSHESNIYQLDECGYYWTSTPEEDSYYSSYILQLDVDGGSGNRVGTDSRYYGQSIRPVRK